MILDIKHISGKSLNQVIKVLGAPTDSKIVTPSRVPQDIKRSEKYYFKNDQIEIVFIDGIADWITINNPKVPYNAGSISELGLPRVKPSFQNQIVIRWNNIEPFNEIAIFSRIQDDLVNYFYIKSFQD